MSSKKSSSKNHNKNNNNKSGPSFPQPSMSSRTVNVSSDGGPPQAMTPEAAARYVQQATTSSNNREVKISFGPSRPPPSSSSGRTSSSSASAAAAAAAGAMSFGSLDWQALKETAAAAAAVQRRGATPDELPCSDAEMKALMEMFVEIIGVGMDTDGGKPGSNSKSSPSPSNGSNRKNAPPSNPMFMFGNQPPNGMSAPWPDHESLAAATAGFFADGASWDAIRRTYGAVYNGSDLYANEYDDDDDDEEDEDNESIPELDDMCDLLDDTGRRRSSANTTSIAPGDWASLEKVAVEDALEAEDRARKASKKREKKQRRKQKQKEEAAAKAADATEKKREKAILSWRSRVVSACQSGELPKLEVLLQESPLNGKSIDDPDIDESAMLPHLEFLLPNSIAKNRTQLERGKETRHRLANYILSLELRLAFVRLRSGRSALHTACFHGDLPFVELVLEHLDRFLQEKRPSSNTSGEVALSRDELLNKTCTDSGWTPLHYAAVSGSTDMLEVLLRAGCNVHAPSNLRIHGDAATAAA